MRAASFLARICLAASALLMTACGKPPPASVFPNADAALDRMKATYACANGVQGTAKIDLLGKQGRVRGELLLFAVNPDRVRFDVVSPFGAVIYTLTADGQRFQMLDMKEKQFLHGPASPCNLARMTRVPIPGHALVSLLRGEAPLLVHQPNQSTIAWDTSNGGFYRVIVPSTRDARQEVHLAIRPDDWDKPWSQQRLRVTYVSVVQKGAEHYVADLSNHEAATTAPPRVDPDGIDEPVPPSGGQCDAELPQSIHIHVPYTDDDVIFQYKKAHWNPPIVPGAFEQPTPGGVRLVHVTCDAP